MSSLPANKFFQTFRRAGASNPASLEGHRAKRAAGGFTQSSFFVGTGVASGKGATP